MNSVVPLISRLPIQLQKRWRQRLESALPEERIMLADILSPDEKDKIEIAIVADPDPKLLELFPNLSWVHRAFGRV